MPPLFLCEEPAMNQIDMLRKPAYLIITFRGHDLHGRRNPTVVADFESFEDADIAARAIYNSAVATVELCGYNERNVPAVCQAYTFERPDNTRGSAREKRHVRRYLSTMSVIFPHMLENLRGVDEVIS